MDEAFLHLTYKAGIRWSSKYSKSFYNRCFWNKCDIVEEPNSSSKHGVRVKFFSLIKRISVLVRI